MTPRPARPTSRRALAALGVALLLAPLAGCTGDAQAPAPAPGGLELTDGWVKAADSGMTAAFGTLVNGGDADVVLVAGSSPAAASVELHETVADDQGGRQMRPVDAVVVPAGGTVVLEPGGTHVMLMGLTGAIEPGAEVELTLTAQDGTDLTVRIPAKEFAGADEDYAGTDGEMTDGDGEE